MVKTETSSGEIPKPSEDAVDGCWSRAAAAGYGLTPGVSRQNGGLFQHRDPVVSESVQTMEEVQKKSAELSLNESTVGNTSTDDPDAVLNHGRGEGKDSFYIPQNRETDVSDAMDDILDGATELKLEDTANGTTYLDCTGDSPFWAVFTHAKGGTLQKEGSDVILRVPPRAVPEGQTYKVTGIIHRNLKDYNHWMESDNEYIVGPVPEYTVDGGGDFQENVEICLPHCMQSPIKGRVRVLYGTGKDFKEVSKGDDITYSIDDEYVYISTKHFTRFIVSLTNQNHQEITDALLTVAASKNDTPNKSFITLRLMLHCNCATLNDFSEQRSCFYDPYMEEIRLLKVTLPDTPEPQSFPKITIKACVDEGSASWKLIDTHNDENQLCRELTMEVDGQNVLKVPTTGPRHRSEQLCDFVFEKGNVQKDPIICVLTVSFDYSEQLSHKHPIHVVFPKLDGIDLGRRRTSSLLSDPLNEVFKEISGKIETAFGCLATQLNISQQVKQQIERTYTEHYDRNYHLLVKWRAASGSEGTIDILCDALEKCQRNDLAELAQTTHTNSRLNYSLGP